MFYETIVTYDVDERTNRPVGRDGHGILVARARIPFRPRARHRYRAPFVDASTPRRAHPAAKSHPTIGSDELSIKKIRNWWILGS